MARQWSSAQTVISVSKESPTGKIVVVLAVLQNPGFVNRRFCGWRLLIYVSPGLRHFVLFRECLRSDHINDILHISTRYRNRLDQLCNWLQFTIEDIIHVPIRLHLRQPSQSAQDRLNVLHLHPYISHRQLVRRLGIILAQRGQLPKGPKPCPQYRIWSDILVASDRFVASRDTSTIGMADDTDLFDRVTLDSSNSVCENGDSVVVCEVELAKKMAVSFSFYRTQMMRGDDYHAMVHGRIAVIKYTTDDPPITVRSGDEWTLDGNVLGDISMDKYLFRWKYRWTRMPHHRLWYPGIGTSNPENLESTLSDTF